MIEEILKIVKWHLKYKYWKVKFEIMHFLKEYIFTHHLFSFGKKDFHFRLRKFENLKNDDWVVTRLKIGKIKYSRF